MKKRIAACLAAALAVTGFGLIVSAAPAQALGKIKCDTRLDGTEDNDGDVSLRATARDAIVYHRVDHDPDTNDGAPQPHQHEFFGNHGAYLFNNFATYQELINHPWRTSCRDIRDTAGYWVPSLVYTSGPKAGQRVPVQQFTAYYRGFAGQTTHAGTQAIPAGARLVASDMVGYGISGWNCGQNSVQSATQGPVNFIPNCSGEDGSPGNTLTAHVNFPSCWNGVLPNHPGDPNMVGVTDNEYGDTRDNNNGVAGTFTSNDFIYPTNKTACPASHPIEVTQLRETVQYAYTGDGTDVALSSDFDHNGNLVSQRGSTFHADFWNTWQQAGFVQFVQDCIQTAAEASCDP